MKKLIVFLALCIISYAAISSNIANVKKPEEINTKIFVMFRSEGRGHEADWDSQDMQRLLTNEEILNELEKRCKGIEFVGKTDVVDVKSSVEDFNMQKNIDGIVVFGPPPEEFIKTGLPIITVFRMWQTWMSGFDFQRYKKEKILFYCVPMVRDREKSTFFARMDGLAKKIRLIQAISQMDYRILSITDASNFLGAYEGGSDEYAIVFKENVAEIFGTEFKGIPQEELFNKIKEVNEQKAENIAEKWIEGAYAMKNTNKTQVIRSAKVYLAMKALKGKYNCDAVTAEGYGVFGSYKKGTIPSQGLAASQFSTDGILTPGETLIDCMLTQQIGYNFTGKGSFNGDYIVDPFLDIAIIGHCECPLNILGDDAKNCTYSLRNLPYHKKNEGGACIQVNLPVNKTVTMVKMSMYNKKIAISTGKAISGEKLFSEWNQPGVSCRTKLAIKTNTKALLENLDWETFLHHRVVFYGNYREEFKDLAKLIGFEVVEEDKNR